MSQAIDIMVGVAGFEPATPSSRTTVPCPKALILIDTHSRKQRERTGNRGRYGAIAVPVEETMTNPDDLAALQAEHDRLSAYMRDLSAATCRLLSEQN